MKYLSFSFVLAQAFAHSALAGESLVRYECFKNTFANHPAVIIEGTMPETSHGARRILLYRDYTSRDIALRACEASKNNYSVIVSDVASVNTFTRDTGRIFSAYGIFDVNGITMRVEDPRWYDSEHMMDFVAENPLDAIKQGLNFLEADVAAIKKPRASFTRLGHYNLR